MACFPDLRFWPRRSSENVGKYYSWCVSLRVFSLRHIVRRPTFFGFAKREGAAVVGRRVLNSTHSEPSLPVYSAFHLSGQTVSQTWLIRLLCIHTTLLSPTEA